MSSDNKPSNEDEEKINDALLFDQNAQHTFEDKTGLSGEKADMDISSIKTTKPGPDTNKKQGGQ
jgi:hypothetical protein